MSIDLRRLLELYDRCGPLERLFVRIRSGLIPFSRIETEIGTARRILDLACGHGLLVNFLSLSDPNRTVAGIDLSQDRIRTARSTIRERAGVSFSIGDIARSRPSGFEAVTLIDALHYFEPRTQAALLKSCYEALLPGGTFILRDGNADGGWRHALNYLHEAIMTAQGLHFQGSDCLSEMLREAGFEDLKVTPCAKILPYADTLYVCRRRV